MKTIFKTGLAALAIAAVAPSANAQSVSINYNPSAALPTYTTATVIQTFDYAGTQQNVQATNANLPALNLTGTGVTGATQSVNTNVRMLDRNINGLGVGANTASTGGTGTSGKYLAILAGGSYTLNFGTAGVQFLSFVFGGLDSFNAVTLNFANGSSKTLTGAQIIGGATAGALPAGTVQAPGSNNTNFGVFGRASYDAQGASSIVSAIFSSTTNTFEIDSIAAAAPEPGTWAMMLLGFGVVGSQIRRRRKAGSATLATA